MPAPLLKATSISKSFSGVQALKNVTFELLEGEVHALIGENGAGKSTLIRTITGAITADFGTLEVRGKPVPHNNPGVARALGIAAIYQQPSLFPDLSVAENIALTLEGAGLWRRVNWKERRRRAVELIDRTGTAVHPDRRVSNLSMPEQQIVEIARAIGADAKILMMDEPTASLTDREAQNLFKIIALLRSQGAGIIYISHRLEEVATIADRITVLRDGETIATRHREEADKTSLIKMMVGREISAVFPRREVRKGDVAFELQGVGNRALGLRDVTLSVRSGEILGLAGLVGSGRTELAETVFGLTPADSGDIRINGTSARIATPAQAIGLGIGYVPEDRRRHGVVLEMPVCANISLASLNRVSRRGLIDSKQERTLARSYVHQLRIKAPSIHSETGSLSGGNQQKVALARWLAIEPKVLILDEPTQGVDVGSKSEIHGLHDGFGGARTGDYHDFFRTAGDPGDERSNRGDASRERSPGSCPVQEATQQKILSLALGHLRANRAYQLTNEASRPGNLRGRSDPGAFAGLGHGLRPDIFHARILSDLVPGERAGAYRGAWHDAGDSDWVRSTFPSVPFSRFAASPRDCLRSPGLPRARRGGWSLVWRACFRGAQWRAGRLRADSIHRGHARDDGRSCETRFAGRRKGLGCRIFRRLSMDGIVSIRLSGGDVSRSR